MFSNTRRTHLSQEDYRPSPGYSSSDVRAVLQAGLHPLVLQERDQKPPSEAMTLGSAFDCLVLEPHLFEARYKVLSPAAKAPSTDIQREFVNLVVAGMDVAASHASVYATTSAAKAEALYGELEEWIVALRASQTPLTASAEQSLLAMHEALFSHISAAKMLDGEKQVTLAGEYDGVTFKGMPDIVRGSTNVDLKTTSTWGDIKRQFFQRGYDVQHAIYGQLNRGRIDAYENIYVESVAPYRVKWVDVTEYVENAIEKTEDAVSRIAYAHNNGAWTHAREYYEGGYELL